MQIKFKIIIFGIVGLLSLFSFFAHADEDRNPLDSSYLFFLYYDNGQIFSNRDFEFKYDVIPETFVPEIFNTQFPYKGEVINLKGEVVETFQFDPRQSNTKFLKGALSVKAPYVPDGQKVIFFDGQGNQLLSIFVSESSFCNDDGVCNANVGEDNKTCPSDCKATPSVPVAPTTDDNAGGGTSGMFKGIIYLIIGLGIVGGWYGWKWWKGRQETSMTSFPMPPLPPNNPTQ